jgi:hypothetical protein
LAFANFENGEGFSGEFEIADFVFGDSLDNLGMRVGSWKLLSQNESNSLQLANRIIRTT